MNVRIWLIGPSYARRRTRDAPQDMKIYDRVTLSGSRFLLANKYTRAFLFFYTIMLHSLVRADCASSRQRPAAPMP
jgi:hypothetical protein